MCCPAVFSHSTSFSSMPKTLHCVLYMPALEMQETGEGRGNIKKLMNRKVEIADI